MAPSSWTITARSTGIGFQDLCQMVVFVTTECRTPVIGLSLCQRSNNYLLVLQDFVDRPVCCWCSYRALASKAQISNSSAYQPFAVRRRTHPVSSFTSGFSSRQRTGPYGKLWTARQAFPNPDCDFHIVDDNVKICQEFHANGHSSTHIRLPRRAEFPGHKSFASKFEAGSRLRSWIEGQE